MRTVIYPWRIDSLTNNRPTVGWLMDLCEENYSMMLRLAPGLRTLEGCYLSTTEGDMELYMEVLEQTPYTTLVHLTYYFSHIAGSLPDPDATLRIYYDSAQVEVLDLRQHALPLGRGPEWPTLEQKWKANLFFSKWLSYCVQQRHQFTQARSLDRHERSPMTTYSAEF
ncbi:MAG: DUF1249 domain-containing protein [Gammaproteobacteria bacterium]|nr:DUF1249 domain-containing protein [Gammaproteobacteria bacterium]